jgi:large subunit ribosomal protein L4
METKLFDKQGKQVGQVKLSEQIFNQDVNKTLLWENITAFLKNKRRGTAKTKNRAEVRGGGVKPWRQKGIGWARHGSIRSPIWRGGGVVFGPKPRDYSVSIPKKKKLKALISSLSALAKENKILVIENLNIETPKTKIFVDLLKSINLEKTKTLIGVEDINKNLKLACRNIPYVNLKRADDVNCLDVLWADYLLITKKGLSRLEKRCGTKKS